MDLLPSRKKKHLIGYWVFDNENVKLDAVKIDNTKNTRIWFETGSHSKGAFCLQITHIHIPPYTKFEYLVITSTEFDNWETEITSDKELDKLDLCLRFADDEHVLRLHRTK